MTEEKDILKESCKIETLVNYSASVNHTFFRVVNLIGLKLRVVNVLNYGQPQRRKVIINRLVPCTGFLILRSLALPKAEF